MTKIIIKKRKTLSLKLPEPEQAKSEVKEKKTPADIEEMERQQQELRKKKTSDCRKWLTSNFPEVFNMDEPKPLAIGIADEIKVAYLAAGGLEVLGFGCHLPVRRVLTKWVRHRLYHEAMTQEGAMRHNLKGQPVEPVSDEHANRANVILMSISKSKKKKA
jgi:sRNA-binding protein